MTLGVLVFHATDARSADEVCLDSKEHDWVKAQYDDLFARYDTAKVARHFLQLNNEAGVLRDQVASCAESGGEPTSNQCPALRRQLEAKLAEERQAADTLTTALQMQTYILTLQLRLERPICQQR